MSKFSEYQKTVLTIQSDFSSVSFSVAEKEKVLDAVDGARGNGSDMLGDFNIDLVSGLAPELSNKVNDALDDGMLFAIELEKIKQRGVNFMFTEGAVNDCLLGKFSFKPRVLFYVGNIDLLNDCNSKFYFSVKSFCEAGCAGVLIPDVSLNKCLQDACIANALRELRILILSDSAKRKAHVKKSCVSDPACVVFDDAGSVASVATSSASASAKAKSAKPASANSPTSVFVSGSRNLGGQLAGPLDSLRTIIEKGFNVLIGDSPKGFDAKCVDFLMLHAYEKVKVYTVSAGEPRVTVNNNWEVVNVVADRSLTGQKKQMVKDRKMSDEADYGMAVFDPVSKNMYNNLQVSSGTLRNAIQMLMLEKPVKFFYLYEGVFRVVNLKTLEGLHEILQSYAYENISESERLIISSCRGFVEGDNTAQFKCDKLLKKFNELKKGELIILNEKRCLS